MILLVHFKEIGRRQSIGIFIRNLRLNKTSKIIQSFQRVYIRRFKIYI